MANHTRGLKRRPAKAHRRVNESEKGIGSLMTGLAMDEPSHAWIEWIEGSCLAALHMDRHRCPYGADCLLFVGAKVVKMTWCFSKSLSRSLSEGRGQMKSAATL
jgi:hypothetical protein